MKITKFYPKENSTQRIYLIDASKYILGRLSSMAALLLIGKYNTIYNPSTLSNNIVVIYNADKIKLSTKQKWEESLYYTPTNRPGNLKSITAKNLLGSQPHKLLEKSILGMLPKNRLRKKMFNNLYVYAFNIKNTSIISELNKYNYVSI